MGPSLLRFVKSVDIYMYIYLALFAPWLYRISDHYIPYWELLTEVQNGIWAGQ